MCKLAVEMFNHLSQKPQKNAHLQQRGSQVPQVSPKPRGWGRGRGSAVPPVLDGVRHVCAKCLLLQIPSQEKAHLQRALSLAEGKRHQQFLSFKMSPSREKQTDSALLPAGAQTPWTLLRGPLFFGFWLALATKAQQATKGRVGRVVRRVSGWLCHSSDSPCST